HLKLFPSIGVPETTGTAGRTDMRTRRLTGAALGVLAACAFALSGCNGTDDDAAPSATAGTPSAPASSSAADPAAAQALGNAAAALGDTSFKMSLTSGPSLKMTATLDAPNGRGASELTA